MNLGDGKLVVRRVQFGDVGLGSLVTDHIYTRRYSDKTTEGVHLKRHTGTFSTCMFKEYGAVGVSANSQDAGSYPRGLGSAYSDIPPYFVVDLASQSSSSYCRC